MFFFCAGLLIGGLITLAVAYVYYRKSYTDQNTLYNKISKDIRDAILQDSRERLTVKELNDIIDQKTIDPESTELFQWKVCPKCGSIELKGGEHTDYERDNSYYFIKCKNCGWNDWTQ